MPNHCMNIIKMEFRNEESAKQLQKDLKELGDKSENLCELVMPGDVRLWGTKGGTYNLSLDSEDSNTLEYYCDTAWSHVYPEVLEEIVKKYDLTSIVNHYWEPGYEFAGTLYSCSDDGEICDTDDDYQIICVEDITYNSFVKMIGLHCSIGLPEEQAKVLFEKFKDYEYMYLSFERQAYQALADNQSEPMFCDFVKIEKRRQVIKKCLEDRLIDSVIGGNKESKKDFELLYEFGSFRVGSRIVQNYDDLKAFENFDQAYDAFLSMVDQNDIRAYAKRACNEIFIDIDDLKSDLPLEVAEDGVSHEA